MLTKEKIAQLAMLLRQAEIEVNPIDPLSETDSLQEADSYEIQKINIDAKCAEGMKIVGKKIGLTSKPMQDMFGVNTPDFGYLLDTMISENGEFESDKLLQPRVEAEIAFVLKEDLMGPEVTVEAVLDATDYVVASFEIVDSRIRDWKIKIADTIADNASSGRYVLATKRVDPKQTDLRDIQMSLYKNDALVNSGEGSAALGHPAYCVAWLANKMSSYGVPLKKGEVVLSGALSAAVPASKGDTFKATFSELGTVTAKFI
ncbi:MAG: 2-keto-4-pentenoate hydratase [Clostridiales bacterium]|nr:2-keto-4-pentenoate hydratase [Clostridiales bacterium]MDN5299623.1 2-keto-4-pentenoate hydratase [Clostridiales bacterium]